MAGPLSTNEIEDVVSSVRRLVSTEPLPKALSRELGQDKLLLTPSLRVVAANAGNASAPQTAPAAARTPLILTTPNWVDRPESGAAGGPDDRFHLIEAEWEDELWSAPEAPLAELALGAEEAEVLTPEPVAAWPEAEADWIEEPPIPFSAFAGPEAPAPQPEQVFGAGPFQALPSEAAASENDDLDVADMLTAAMLEDEPFTRVDASELHALVRTMVRNELQGSLGERITRNVRKLVRTEINRALAARSLD